MPPQRRVRLAVVLFVVVLAVGVVGYQVLEGMTPLDALYMTVITVTTVGFNEIAPLEGGGKVFTIGLIAAGVAVVTFAAASGVDSSSRAISVG